MGLIKLRIREFANEKGWMLKDIKVLSLEDFKQQSVSKETVLITKLIVCGY